MKLHENSLKYISQAANIGNINELLIKKFNNPDNIHKAEITIKLDNGNTKSFFAFRSQHNNLAGIYKGGIRFHPEVDANMVSGLSTEMTIKTAVLSLPLGGGKGGVCCNPKELSENELEQISRGYIKAFKSVLGPYIDVPAPDVNTNSQIMAWMQDEYLKYNKTGMGVVTGKPLEFGGSLGRDRATSLGGLYVLECAAKSYKFELKGMSVIIQGFGNAGYNFGLFAEEKGMKVIGISDSKGGLINQNGIDIKKAHITKREKGSVTCIEGEIVDNKGLLATKCDLLVLAAFENQITEENMESINTKHILELANGPISPNASEYLEGKRNILIMPDVLANAGGVAVSGMELSQNLTNDYWTLESVNMKLKNIVENAWVDIFDNQQKLNCGLRTATYVKALKRLEKIAQLRGCIK